MKVKNLCPKGVACVDPPFPTNGTNLVRHYVEGTTVAFGAKVNYTCTPGYLFDTDKDKASIEVECKSDGTWNAPAEWEKCYNPSGRIRTTTVHCITSNHSLKLISERYCLDPPSPSFNGGLTTWNSTLVTLL